jgi:hypothetical protein
VERSGERDKEKAMRKQNKVNDNNDQTRKGYKNKQVKGNCNLECGSRLAEGGSNVAPLHGGTNIFWQKPSTSLVIITSVRILQLECRGRYVFNN